VTARLPQRADNEAGFTLLEALIATAMMAMVLTSLATITAQWMPSWNRGLARVERSEHVALGLERIAADLAAAEFVPPTRSAKLPFFDGTERSVSFVRTALGPNAGPGLEVVRLHEAKTDQGPTLVRVQTPFAPLPAFNFKDLALNFTDTVVLLRPPYRLLLSYAAGDRIWQDAWQDQATLPKSVRLRVQDAKTQRTLAVSTATVVRAGLPVECARSKSYAECLVSNQKQPESDGPNKSRM
jgi:general secretion pathway protein J